MDLAEFTKFNPSPGAEPLHNNILIFGFQNAGVSSFVNTLATSLQPPRTTSIVKSLSKQAAPNSTSRVRITQQLTRSQLSYYLPQFKTNLWESWGISTAGGADAGNNYDSLELDLLMQGMLPEKFAMPRDQKAVMQVLSQVKKPNHYNMIHAVAFVIAQSTVVNLQATELTKIKAVLKQCSDRGRTPVVLVTKIDQMAGSDDGDQVDEDQFAAVVEDVRKITAGLLGVDAAQVSCVINYNSARYEKVGKRMPALDALAHGVLTLLLEKCRDFHSTDPAAQTLLRAHNPNAASLMAAKTASGASAASLPAVTAPKVAAAPVEEVGTVAGDQQAVSNTARDASVESSQESLEQAGAGGLSFNLILEQAAVEVAPEAVEVVKQALVKPSAPSERNNDDFSAAPAMDHGGKRGTEDKHQPPVAQVAQVNTVEPQVKVSKEPPPIEITPVKTAPVPVKEDVTARKPTEQPKEQPATPKPPQEPALPSPSKFTEQPSAVEPKKVQPEPKPAPVVAAIVPSEQKKSAEPKSTTPAATHTDCVTLATVTQMNSQQLNRIQTLESNYVQLATESAELRRNTAPSIAQLRNDLQALTKRSSDLQNTVASLPASVEKDVLKAVEQMHMDKIHQDIKLLQASVAASVAAAKNATTPKGAPVVTPAPPVDTETMERLEKLTANVHRLEQELATVVHTNQLKDGLQQVETKADQKVAEISSKLESVYENLDAKLGSIEKSAEAANNDVLESVEKAQLASSKENEERTAELKKEIATLEARLKLVEAAQEEYQKKTNNTSAAAPIEHPLSTTTATNAAPKQDAVISELFAANDLLRDEIKDLSGKLAKLQQTTEEASKKATEADEHAKRAETLANGCKCVVM